LRQPQASQWLNASGDDASGNPTHPPTMTHEQVISGFLNSQESLTRLGEGYYQVFAPTCGCSGRHGRNGEGGRRHPETVALASRTSRHDGA
jgi:hypothetical protein